MKKLLVITALGALFLGSSPAFADNNKPHHFKGLEAPDLTTALANLSEYNQHLSQLVQKSELSAEDLVEVHKLTYTLENALERIDTEVKDIAETLERVHVASETMKPETVQSEGAKYLEKSNLLTGGAK